MNAPRMKRKHLIAWLLFIVAMLSLIIISVMTTPAKKAKPIEPTMKEFEEYLNELTIPIDSTLWIINGNSRRNCYPNYGTALRRHNQYVFAIVYIRYCKNYIHKLKSTDHA